MFIKHVWTLPASAKVSMPNKTKLIPVQLHEEFPNLCLSWGYSPYHKHLNKCLLLLILQVFLFLLTAPLLHYSSCRIPPVVGNLSIPWDFCIT